VANLPYGISSAFLKKFLTAKNKPQSITLLLQREVAERICAPAGEMSLLSVSVQLYARPQIIKIISQKSFYPPPKVESAIIHLDRITDFPYTEMFSGLTDRQAEKKYWQVLRAGFCSKRKTLENNLANSFHLPKNKVKQAILQAGLAPAARAQELSLDDWLKLTFKLQDFIDETR
jgi:16S rRNA (adenine1518-N6/adenine1519-N6)-dimethyltransferase